MLFLLFVWFLDRVKGKREWAFGVNGLGNTIGPSLVVSIFQIFCICEITRANNVEFESARADHVIIP